jgi:predicted nucleic acid-binding protein
MMTEVVLDANVIVALLYSADAQHARARQLVERLEAGGSTPVFVDFLVFEALSVLCRRALQRKTDPPDLEIALQTIRAWFDGAEVRFLAGEAQRLSSTILDIVAETKGQLNANDAILVALSRERSLQYLATFDVQLSNVRGVQCLL